MALCLTRKVGDAIRIGEGIRIVVKEIRGKQVRLDIIAPREHLVWREEIWLEMQEEKASGD